jgi:dTDP-4-dehydrorhamnose reductase
MLKLAKEQEEVRTEYCRPGEFPMKVPLPKYSMLENKGLKDIGLDTMTYWQDGLKEFLAKIT